MHKTGLGFLFASTELNSFRRLGLAGVIALLLSGCGSYGVIKNEPIASADTKREYSLKSYADFGRPNDIAVILSFSGGGTRAAAMAYGVLQELRDTQVTVNGTQKRLLDEVDQISSVSGGSFTAAYYGLNGESTFETFEDAFLRKDVEGHMKWSLFRPIHWFGSKDRTQRAIEYYQKILFHDATFDQMLRPDGPFIVINASDLATGVRWSFIQGYFDLLCSDLSSFPVANAVAASSAVPVVFNPVVIENYPDCADHQFKISPEVRERMQTDPEMAMLYDGIQAYDDKQGHKYVFLVDGGITDNLGLRAFSDVINVSGGPKQYLERLHREAPSKVIFIAVDASTHGATDLGETNRQPGILTQVNAMADVQLHRYNAATETLVRNEIAAWAEELSAPDRPVKAYFVEITIDSVSQPQLKLFLNKVPTSFSLTNEQVDTLIESARSLLRDQPNYQEFLRDLSSPQALPRE